MENKKSNCKGCGAEIRWIQTQNGKAHPLDFNIVQAESENVLLYDESLLKFRKMKKGEYGYISHFATCPKANEFKKSKSQS